MYRPFCPSSIISCSRHSLQFHKHFALERNTLSIPSRIHELPTCFATTCTETSKSHRNHNSSANLPISSTYVPIMPLARGSSQHASFSHSQPSTSQVHNPALGATVMLAKQLKEINKAKDLPGISCGLMKENIFEWEVMLMISDDCKYYGGMLFTHQVSLRVLGTTCIASTG